MAVVNSNSGFWRQNGRYRWNFECLQAFRLSEPIVYTFNMMLLTSHRIQNTSNEAWKQAKSKKRPKSADLVVLRLSQREKIEKSHFLEEESIFFKILPTAFLSTWMQTYLRPISLNVDLVRRNFDFCFFGPRGHFPKFCHHGFQNRLKTSIFDQNRSILAQMKAKTMLLHVVQSASLSRFYRKHYLPSNLLENRKSWNPSVNSATVIFGAKMAVKDEILNVYKLADPQNPLSALPIWCF